MRAYIDKSGSRITAPLGKPCRGIPRDGRALYANPETTRTTSILISRRIPRAMQKVQYERDAVMPFSKRLTIS